MFLQYNNINDEEGLPIFLGDYQTEIPVPTSDNGNNGTLVKKTYRYRGTVPILSIL